MKKIFSILLSLALVVGLSLVTAAPVMAVDLPSIDPTSAEYDLCNPQHIAVDLDLGDATHLGSIEDDDNQPISANTTTTYVQFENLVVISATYLGSKLQCVGEEWIFQFNFEPFGVAFLTVTCVGTPPALEESSMDWDFWAHGDVVVGTDYGDCTVAVTDVSDAGGSIGAANWTDGGTTLTIKDSYLIPELTSIGDDVELTVEFDMCYDDPLTAGTDYYTTTLTIEAAGVTAPRLAPTSGVYDKCNPGNVEFDITWAGATGVNNITDVTSLALPKLVNPGYYNVSGDTLTLYQAYVAGATAIYGWVYLEVEFNDAATTKVTVQITAEWSDQPWMGVTSNIYTYDIDTTPGVGNLGVLGVGSLVNFGCANNVTGVQDSNGYHLLKYISNDCKCLGAGAYRYDYNVLYVPGYGFLVTAAPSYYLDCTLTKLGDSVTLNIAFDKGANATFVINAVGTQPALDPTSAEFNLDAPTNVTTVVDLGPHATDIVGVTGSALVKDTDYYWDGSHNLTIDADYLAGVLTEVGAVTVLTIDFDEGDDGKLTITAVGTPLCFIATAAGADAPQLDILREFRDKVLRPNPLGAKLVSLYYKTSPPIAELISQNEALRTVVNGCVDSIAAILNWSHGLWS